MPFKVAEFGTSRKLIMRLPVINTNLGLPHILNRFRDIAFDRSKIAIGLSGHPLAFNPLPLPSPRLERL